MSSITPYIIFPILYTLYQGLVALFFSSTTPGFPCISLAFAVYAIFSAIASVIGMHGLRYRNATFLFIFSNHLLLDACLSVIPTAAAFYLARSVGTDVCSTRYIPERSYGKFRTPASNIATVDAILELLSGQSSLCQAEVLLGQGVFATCAVALIFTRWKAAMTIRRLAIDVDLETARVGEESAVCEKQRLMSASQPS